MDLCPRAAICPHPPRCRNEDSGRRATACSTMRGHDDADDRQPLLMRGAAISKSRAPIGRGARACTIRRLVMTPGLLPAEKRSDARHIASISNACVQLAMELACCLHREGHGGEVRGGGGIRRRVSGPNHNLNHHLCDSSHDIHSSWATSTPPTSRAVSGAHVPCAVVASPC